MESKYSFDKNAENLKELEIGNNLKQIDSGHTFFSFISKNNVFIFGSIKDYLNQSNWKLDKSTIVRISEMIYEPYKTIITKIEFRNSFVPIHVSCNKFSIGILLKNKEKKYLLQEGIDKNSQMIFDEIVAVLKRKNLSFQAYFLNDCENENLFSDNLAKKFSINFIPEDEFKDKLAELINTFSIKSDMEIFWESLKKSGIKEGSKINILKLYQALEGVELSETKMVIIGDFQKNWIEEFKRNFSIGFNSTKKHTVLQNWNRIYKEHAMFFELPKIYLPIRQIEMGENHALILTVDGLVYGFGDGSLGATGSGIKNFHCIPTLVNFLKFDIKISKIVAGGKHSFALSDKNSVYSWGCGMHGRLGLGHERDVFQPRSIDLFGNMIVTHIDAGDTYSACVTSEGDLFTWGHGEYGRLGLEEIVNVSIPTKVSMFGSKVASVKCGYYSTLIVTRDNNTYTIGCKSISYAKKNATYALYDNAPIIHNLDGIFYRQIDLSNLRGELPLHAVCGYQYITMFTVLPDSEEKATKDDRNLDYVNGSSGGNTCNIYVSGNLSINIIDNPNFRPFKLNNENSLIAQEDLDDLVKFSRTSGKKDFQKQTKGIKKIICSNNNTAVISKDGDLFTFGSSEYSLASDIHDNFTIPVQPKGIKILGCALGLNHIIMLSYSNEIFSAGRNKEGQLGLGHLSDIVDLSQGAIVEKLKEFSIKKCFACENYSAVVTNDKRVFLFGDISFTEYSNFQNMQSEPKQMSWGEVDDIALAPDHILMATKHPTKSVEIKAIGNGTYGKLGDNSKEQGNQYNPVSVDIKLPNYITFKQIKLACSRYTSAVLIKDKENKAELYVWGVCYKYLFNHDQRELNKNVAEDMIKLPFESSLIVSKPKKQTYFKENIKTFAITDNLIYIINDKNELKYCGSFFSMRDKKNKSLSVKIQNSQGLFKKISVAIDHAGAISLNEKLYTWGYNISNKLGFKSNLQIMDMITEERLNEFNDYDNMERFLVSSPTILTEFNKIFDKVETYQEDTLKKEESFMKNKNLALEESKNSSIRVSHQTSLKASTGENFNKGTPNSINSTNLNTPLEVENEKIKEIPQYNLFSSTQALVEKFEKLECTLIDDEFYFKSQMKDILKRFEFLVDYEKNTKDHKKSLCSQFNFKMTDPPLGIKLKSESYSKLPEEYLNYKKNFKAFLTTLHIHPCYLLKIYESNCFSDKELYKIIKQLYFNIYDNSYSRLLLITLIKMIIQSDLSKLKQKLENNMDKSKNILDNYIILKLNNGVTELNLFARLCKFFIKTDLKFTKKLEFLSLFLISNVYSKTAAKGSSVDWEKSMLIRYHPSIKGKSRDMNDIYSYYRNARIEMIFSIINSCCELLGTNESDMDSIKNNPLFSGFNFEKRNKSDSQNLFMSLGKSITLLITEIFNTICEFLNGNIEGGQNTIHTDSVIEWLTKNFPYLIFHRLIKILENPMNNISIDANIMVDISSFKRFMEKSPSNFYSLSFVLKYCLIILSNPGETENDEIVKLVLQKFNEHRSTFYSAVKKIITGDLCSFNMKEKPKDFDLLLVSEFFEHSLTDRNHIINFSLCSLKRLQDVVVNNIDSIRILNKGFDLMDIIFFNKKQQFYIGEDRGLKHLDVEDDRIVQVRLKTRSLALQKVDSLMKCQHCKIILLHDFILSNESPFYKEFNFLSRSTKEGAFIKVLKSCDRIYLKKEEICNFLEEQLLIKDKNEFKDNLYFLFTLLADDQKKFYIGEEDIQIPDVLIKKMFSMQKNTINLIMKECCKQINSKYEEMKNHLEYSSRVKQTLNEIKNLSADNNFTFRKNLFEKINKNFERGFGNPDLLKYSNSFKNSTKLLKLDKQIKNIPKSNLYLKLSTDNKKNLIPIREFSLRKLMDDKVIYRVLLEDSDANKNAKKYKIIIEKTKINDYLLTLQKNNNASKNFFACGQQNESGNVKVYSMALTSDMINEVTNTLVTNKNTKNVDNTAIIGSFLEVNPKEFIKILKNLTSIAVSGE